MHALAQNAHAARETARERGLVLALYERSEHTPAISEEKHPRLLTHLDPVGVERVGDHWEAGERYCGRRTVYQLSRLSNKLHLLRRHRRADQPLLSDGCHSSTRGILLACGLGGRFTPAASYAKGNATGCPAISLDHGSGPGAQAHTRAKDKHPPTG